MKYKKYKIRIAKSQTVELLLEFGDLRDILVEKLVKRILLLVCPVMIAKQSSSSCVDICLVRMSLSSHHFVEIDLSGMSCVSSFVQLGARTVW